MFQFLIIHAPSYNVYTKLDESINYAGKVLGIEIFAMNSTHLFSIKTFHNLLYNNSRMMF